VLARICLLTALVAGCAPAVAPLPAAASHAPATPLPIVELKTLDGQPARLQALVGGRVALVTLWATWCDACAAEFDALERLDARARQSGAVVLGVAVGEPHSTVAHFVAGHRLTYASLVDEEFRLADALGQKAVPTTLVIDRAGRVVYTGGALDRHALDALQAALN
jgi:peroxiredoxin